jgi:hypothetical protein
MASLKVIKRNPFKRGDTACFQYVFTQPYAGFNWATVTIDCALTTAAAPTDNTTAAITRIAQPLSVDTSNTATYNFQLTPSESAGLIPGTTYTDECQLKQGGIYVTTPVTGQTQIAQDYVI